MSTQQHKSSKGKGIWGITLGLALGLLAPQMAMAGSYCENKCDAEAQMMRQQCAAADKYAKPKMAREFKSCYSKRPQKCYRTCTKGDKLTCFDSCNRKQNTACEYHLNRLKTKYYQKSWMCYLRIFSQYTLCKRRCVEPLYVTIRNTRGDTVVAQPVAIATPKRRRK